MSRPKKFRLVREEVKIVSPSKRHLELIFELAKEKVALERQIEGGR